MSISEAINRAMQESISYLQMKACCENIDSDTHRAIIVSCWNQDESARRAVAKYLVGLRACAIDAALNIRAQLEDTLEDRQELVQSVLDIVGTSENEFTEDKKRTERNPWIAEAIWHLCLTIAKNRPDIHPVGAIAAIKPINIMAKDKGLDVFAIYKQADGLLGLSIVECKAYKDNPNGAINDAVTFFKNVDGGKYSTRIRQSVQMMRACLPSPLQDAVSKSFWKQNRTYIPNPHFDASIEMDWTNSRASFVDLKPGRTNIIIMPHIISGFDRFFEEISKEMRDFVLGV